MKMDDSLSRGYSGIQRRIGKGRERRARWRRNAKNREAEEEEEEEKMKTDREGEWKDKWQRGKRAREKGRVRDRR